MDPLSPPSLATNCLLCFESVQGFLKDVLACTGLGGRSRGEVRWGWELGGGVLNCYCLKGKACKRPSQHRSHHRDENKEKARRKGRKKALKTHKPNPFFISSCARGEMKQTFKSLPAPSTSFAVPFSFFHALGLLLSLSFVIPQMQTSQIAAVSSEVQPLFQ